MNEIDLSTYKQSCSFLTLSINDKDCNGSTILHDAVYKGKTDIVNLILMQPDVLLTLIDANGYTPIHLAARHKTTSMLELLIAKIVSQFEWPSLTDPHQKLFDIISTQNCSSFCSFDQLNDSADVLMNCLQNPSWSFLLDSDCGQQVRRLLSSVHLRNPYNQQMPIHQAALSGSVECSKILIRKFVSPIAPRDCNDQTPLQLSVVATLAHSSNQQNNQSECTNETIDNCTNLFLSCPCNTSQTINGTEHWDCEKWFNTSINRAQCNAILHKVARDHSEEINMELKFDNSVFLVRQDGQNFVNHIEQGQKKFDASPNFILSIATLTRSYSSDDGLALHELRLPVNEHLSHDQQTWQPTVYHYKIDHSYPADHLIQKWLSNETINNHTCCVSRAVAEYYGSNCIFFINDGPYFRSICELISYHKIYSDGLKGILHIPAFQKHSYTGTEHHALVSNTYDQILNVYLDSCINSEFRYPDLTSLLKDVSEVGSPFTNRLVHQLAQSVTDLMRHGDDGPMLEVTDVKDEMESSPRDLTFGVANQSGKNITYEATCAISHGTTKRCKHLPLIEISKLQISKMLGRGEFGCVWEAKYTGERNSRISVAVKVLNDVSLEGRRDFLREALIMSELRHSCLVRIFGIVNDANLMIVQELLPKGSLLNFCKTRQLPDLILNVWAIQIAKGMEYMERKNVVHRDLAARNVLVSSHYQVKISDFGLSRVAASNRTYTQNNFGPAPIKWYAPESIEFALFTSKSDVWSYGVTLWEMFSAGKLPYGDMHMTSEILHYLKRNRRLEKPLRCSKTTYNLMMLSWIYDYKKRPSFVEINNFFRFSSEYTESFQKADADHDVHDADKPRLEYF